MEKTTKLVGWKYAAFIGGLVGTIAILMYPIAIHPYLFPQKWSKYITL